MTRVPRATQLDSGFTLIEFLVAMVIIAIASVAIAGSLIIGFRTVGATADEVAQSHDAQTLSFWLLPDLQSLGPGSAGVDITHPGGPASSLCSGSLPAGTYVLNLSWTDAIPTSYQADYYITTDSSRQYVLNRYYCSSTARTPTILTLVHHLRSATAVTVCDATTVPACSLPTLQVSTIGPAGQIYTFNVSGAGR